eukprot:TRINITY_DN1643_c0_g1_i1.p1 TRINITY_DN1643_c0_g1~~TRINITY_DN1643_c0_g1_i1.p1  ORF type:complete len:477 (+),score=108.14 TRINITY_DN1643_c0_g1_i1:2-1432(+)
MLRRIGQPLASLHPLFLGKGCITPLLTARDYEERRLRLSLDLPLHSVAVVPGGVELVVCDDVSHPFRQNSDFRYLTGFLEPHSVLLLEKRGDGRVVEHLGVRARNATKEMWDGPRCGVEGVAPVFGIQSAFDVNELGMVLEKFSTHHMFLVANNNREVDEIVQNSPKTGPVNTTHVKKLIQNLRVQKSESEIKLMQHSANIAARAFKQAMRDTAKGKCESEHQLAHRFEFYFKDQFADRVAYTPIAASGENATILHYMNYFDVLRKGELVLVDAGCEYGGYASDITRVWPSSGVDWTPAQSSLYDALLFVQKRLIQMCVVGTSLAELNDLAVRYLSEQLRVLDVFDVEIKPEDDIMNVKGFSAFPHSVGHFLGMDVHDTKLIEKTRKFVPGLFADTGLCNADVEPGIYLPNLPFIRPQFAASFFWFNAERFFRFRGIGLRIEDDIVITDRESLVLTRETPKDREHILDVQLAAADI